MAEFTRLQLPSILFAYPRWVGCAHVCDIGGGSGLFLSGLLEYFIDMKGTVIDLSQQAVDEAIDRFRASNISNRAHAIVRDATTCAPETTPTSACTVDTRTGCDCVVMKGMTSDWDDVMLRDVLAKIYMTYSVNPLLTKSFRLIVIDHFLRTKTDQIEHFKVMMDMLMLSLFGESRHRTFDEISGIASVHFRTTGTFLTTSSVDIIELQPIHDRP